MATFHGPITSLVLQDEAIVWARSERDYDEQDKARMGVVKVDDAARFRACAADYGFTEDGGAPRKAARASKAAPNESA